MDNFNIQINDLNISYYDNLKDAPALIFVHGNSHCALTFFKQFNSISLQNFRLIAIDLPGHGNSDQDHSNDAYTLPYYSNILINFAEKLDLKNSIFIGHSLGGHIVLESLSQLTPKAILIFGTPPVGKPFNPEAFNPNEDGALLFQNELSNEQINKLSKLCFTDDFLNPQSVVESAKITHGVAREKLGASLAIENYSDEVAIVKNSTTPIAVFAAKSDKIVNNHWFNNLDIPTLWTNQIIYIDGGHNIHLENQNEFNSHLKLFAIQTFNLANQNENAAPFESYSEKTSTLFT